MAYSLLLALSCGALRGPAAQYPLYGAARQIRMSAPPAAASPMVQELRRAARRLRAVSLSPRVAGMPHSTDGICTGDTLLLPLFDQRVVTAVVDRIERNVRNTTTVRARLPGCAFAYLLLSYTDGAGFMTLALPEEQHTYALAYDASIGAHIVCDYRETELGALQPGPPLIPPVDPPTASANDRPAGAPAAPPALNDGPNDPATLDVMIVYTPAARTWAGGTAGINNVIANAISRAQTAHDNSGTLISMPLVHAAEVNYIESGSSNTDLSRLQNTSDGYMDDVHTWRNQYGADFVVLLTKVDDVGGLGYLLNTSNGSPSYAFCISRVQQTGTGYTMVHELGHNMGAHHHKQQNTQPGPTAFWNWPQNTWSAGWRWTGTNNVRYCSIMTYESGSYFPDGLTHTRVAHFSNPLISHYGQPTGHAADGDNVRTFNALKHTLAAYRVIPEPHGALLVVLLAPALRRRAAAA